MMVLLVLLVEKLQPMPTQYSPSVTVCVQGIVTRRGPANSE